MAINNSKRIIYNSRNLW